MSQFQEELARAAEKTGRMVFAVGVVGLSLSLFTDLRNLPDPHRFWGLVLRGAGIAVYAGLIVIVWSAPGFFRTHYENLLVVAAWAIAAPVAFNGPWSGDKGMTYFVGILQMEFAFATFFSISRVKFIVTVILCNLLYLGNLLRMNPAGEDFINVAVSLAIFAVVSILTHHLIYNYKYQNFTQRAGLEQYATRIRNILGSITDAFLALDREGRLIFLNAEAERFFSRDGKKTDDLIGKSIWDLYPALVGDSQLYDESRWALQTQQPVRFEEYYPRLNGYFQVHIYPSSNGLSISAHEITRRKLAEEQLKASLEEKDVLLRHIHHGVKNNLQIISSLLNLQSHLTPEKADILRESQNRIKAMALVHEKLYQSNDLAEINFRDFITSVAGNLVDSYGVNRTKIDLDIHIEEIRLEVETAIACGMIINELVANAIKYAFPDSHSSGRIKIAMREDADSARVTFTVSDDGVGFAELPDLERGPTLGLRLVKILTEKQLHGSLTISGEGGAHFEIIFEREAARGPQPQQHLRKGSLGRTSAA